MRHGTVSIISFLEVATGKVFTECIPDHTSSTVIQVIRRHVNQYDSSETLHYILDNYSSHSRWRIWTLFQLNRYLIESQPAKGP